MNPKLNVVRLTIAATIALGFTAAVDAAAYIQFDGIEGDATFNGEPGWIELLQAELKRETSTACAAELVAEKYYDGASGPLYDGFVYDRTFDSEIIFDDTDGSERWQAGQRIRLLGVQITSLDLDKHTGIESLTACITEIKWPTADAKSKDNLK